MEWIVETECFNAVVTQDGSEIQIEFGDGYQQDLVETFGWSTEQAESLDDLIEKVLQEEKGQSCNVYWEDRELFIIEPSVNADGLNAKVVAEVIHGLLPNSKITQEEVL